MEDIWLMPRHVRTGAVCWPNFHVFNLCNFRNLWSQDSCKLAPHCKKFTFKTGSDPPGWNFNKREHWREDDLTETDAERSHISIHLAFIKRILWSNWFVILDGSPHIVLFWLTCCPGRSLTFLHGSYKLHDERLLLSRGLKHSPL